MTRFEADLCTYLNAHASGELRDPTNITHRWATDKSIGHISLLLATLAAGAHYSDVDYPQRLELATDFGTISVSMKREVMLTDLLSSPPILPCPTPRQLPVSPIVRYHSSASYSWKHVAEHGSV